MPLHGERQFHCLTPDHTYSHTWKVNGTVVASNSTFPDIIRIYSQTFANGSTQGSLSLRTCANTNDTDVMCYFANGDDPIRMMYKILIQGMQYVYDFSVYELSCKCFTISQAYI